LSNGHQRALVVVFDALRPEFVTPEIMPNLHRFATDGVRFLNSRSTFPTETRVNQSAVTTGCYPARHGIVANRFVMENDGTAHVLDTGDDVQFEASLNKMTERLFDVPTLGERLTAAGKSCATISAGTSGGGRLINISAEETGAFRLALRRPDAAVPDGIMTEIVKELGPLPDYALPANDWISYAVDCYLEFVEPRIKPDAMLLWLCEPDESFHQRGIGSEDALVAIRHVDAEFGRILKHHADQIADGTLQIVGLSDHGQISIRGEALDLATRLTAAGFDAVAEQSKTPDVSVVVANAGGIWLRQPTPDRIVEITQWLQMQDWCGPLFTRDGASGTLRHAQIGIEHRRAPDIAMVLRYDHESNEWGHKGMSLHNSGYPIGCGCHGGLSSHELHNFLTMSGSAFKEKREIASPTGNVDILPTVLHLLGVAHPEGIDGRILHEALRNGPDEQSIEIAEKTYSSSNDRGPVTHLSVSEVAGTKYINQAWVE